MKHQLEKLLLQAVATLKEKGELPAEATPAFDVEHTKTKEHGDFAANIALVLAKAARAKPRDIATKIVGALPASENVTKVEIAGPGFINFFLSPAALYRIVPEILSAKESFGRSQVGASQPVQVEFVSANPTGPLHVGQDRKAHV